MTYHLGTNPPAVPSASEEGFFTRKVGGLPIWALGAGVLTLGAGLAWYATRKKPAAMQANGSSEEALEETVRAFFSGPGGSAEEFSTGAELLPLLMAEEGHSRVALVAPDPGSYGEEPDLLEVGSISFKSRGAAPPGWEDMWWWPLEEGSRPDPEVMRSPRYHSMLDAAAWSLRDRGGESLGVFGRAPSMPQVRVRVTEFWEDTSYLPSGFSRGWWARLVRGLRPVRAPVKWLGSDDPMAR